MKKKQGAVTVLAVAGLIFLTIYILIMLSGFRGTQQNKKIIENSDPGGYSLFAGLLSNLGYKVKYWDSYDPPGDAGLIILFPDELEKPVPQEKFQNWANKGNVIFVIGTKSGSSLFNNTTTLGDKAPLELHKDVEEDIPEGLTFETETYWEHSYTKRDKSLLKNEYGSVLVQYPAKKGRIYLLSDKDLFSNINLEDPYVAIFLNNIMKEFYHETVYLMSNPPEIITEPSPVMVLLRGDLFFITIHLLLMLLVFYFWQGKSFGPKIRLKIKNRRTITEHLEAVGQFYRRTENPALEDSIDRQYFIQNIHVIMGITRNLPIEQLISKVAPYVEETDDELRALMTNNAEITDKIIISRHKQRNAILKKLSSRGRSKNGQPY